MLEQNLEQEQRVYIQTAKRLNQAFDKGAPAWNMAADLRVFSKPILVDIEHTLFTFPSRTMGTSAACNTLAFRAIQELRSIGNVIYLSNNTEQEKLKEGLIENGLWYQDSVLISRHHWHPKRNEFAGDPVNPIAQMIIRDYVYKFGAAKEADFFLGLKRVAPLFWKYFDIPLIDDIPDFTDDNPGILGLRVKPIITDPEREFDMVHLAENGSDLMEAVEKVRKHYSKTVFTSLHSKIPFRNSLILSEFDKTPFYAIGDDYRPRITYLAGKQDVIVRVSTNPDDMTKRDFLGIGEELALLEDRYDIAVPRHEVVIGPAVSTRSAKTFYLVTDRIHGQSLDKKIYRPEEIDEAVDGLNKLYSSIARYGWDKFLNGGLIIDDISFGNEQYVWGHRVGESSDKIWLTDVGPQMLYFQPRNTELFLIITRLFEMIKQSESHLGRKLTGARETIFNLTKTIPEKDEKYWQVLNLRRKLGDRTAGTEEEDDLELMQILSQYQDSLQKVKLGVKDWEDIAKNFFHVQSNYIRGALAEVTGPDIFYHGHVMRDLNDFRRFEKELFDYSATRAVVQKLRTSLNIEVSVALDARFGPHNIDKQLEPIAKKKQAELSGSFNSVFDKVASESHAGFISKLGWEENILPYLSILKGLFNYRDFMEHFLRVATLQLGWDYFFSMSREEVRKIFSQSGLDQKDKGEWEWSDFVVATVNKDIESKLTDKLKDVENKYGEDVAFALEEGFLERETDKIFRTDD